MIFQLINYVCNECSASTKLFVVTNSSVSRLCGSFNEDALKGSALMNSSLDVLHKFSLHPYALLTDISEAYRST